MWFIVLSLSQYYLHLLFFVSCLFWLWHRILMALFYAFIRVDSVSLLSLLFTQSFSHYLQLMVFHWSLSDSKSTQVFRTLLSILAVLNNILVWMVCTCPPTSKSSSPFSNPFVTVPNGPIIIGVIVTCMFHSSFFFQFPNKVEVLILLFTFFQFYQSSPGTAKSTILPVLFFLLIIIRSGLLTEIRWSVCMSKSHRSLCVFFSRTGA